ncbi:DNAJ heat shock N-terminal domain-containing family protein [Striga asiatica]|uniref:DNAJ heat shock N-terminal domain-containing family protein n=1 Tax=Striga asiatica TaxID=4170 RepID=A0A5A7P2L4_STRAF|nr:DNAJ heat shock N-terminal domain-containing family protein [Striga asiatica]
MSDEDKSAGSIGPSRPEDEALRFKTLAEENFTSGDLKSALKHANRARKLHPSLDGLPEMITAFEILHAAAADDQISSPDYYRILQVERFSHPNTIKKQYKKLALSLHPDKNPSPSSAEAFKLVGEASRVLSDKIRRKEYDMRLRISMQSEAVEEMGPPTAAEEKFWTSCSVCGLVHQFERKYLGQNLVCPRCRKSFKAMEVDKEGKNSVIDVDKSPIRVSARIKEQFAKNGSLGIVEKCGLLVKRKFSSVNEVIERSAMKIERKHGKSDKVEKFGNGKTSKEGNDDSRTRRAVGRVGYGVEKESPSDELEIVESEEDSMTLSQMKVLAKRMKRGVKENLTVKEKEAESEKGEEEREEENNEETKEKTLKVYTRRVRKDRDAVTITTVTSEKDNLEVLQEEESMRQKETKTDGKREKRERRRVSKYGNHKPKKREKSRNQTDLEIERLMAKKDGNLEIMPVEDSDFHDFDRDRKGRSFQKGQVWAVYDDDDGMPRQYALIEKIISVNPFEVNLSWLLFQTKGNETINRRKTRLHFSCGSFEVSRRVSVKYLKLFSHAVDCERAAREVYRIYPSKGSVWALYGDNDGSRDNRCYNIAVCLSGYNELYGLSVGYLEKVPGFRTVFKRKEIGVNGVVNLGKNDVKLFSHQIPAKKLSGEEASGLPKDCWELDPASLAPQLLVET